MQNIMQCKVDLQGIKEVISYARSNGIDTVFFVNDDNAALISRSLDPDLHVAPITKLADGSIIINVREDYKVAHDRGSYSDENILAMTWNEQPENVFEDYMISSYQYVTDVKDYHLYHAGSDKFDDMAGFPLDDNHLFKTTDFCYSPGYQAVGDIDLYGYLETTGNDNYVLVSPLLDAPYATCAVTLTYESGHKTVDDASDITDSDHVIGELVLLDPNYNEIDTTKISSGNSTASIIAEPSRPCYVAVRLNSGAKATLCKIDFEIVPHQ